MRETIDISVYDGKPLKWYEKIFWFGGKYPEFQRRIIINENSIQELDNTKMAIKQFYQERFPSFKVYVE